MTQEFCEREPLVAAAARSGIWPDELENHIGSCPVCAETKRLAQFFVVHAATTSAQSRPLPANLVWQKLQARRRHLAIRRATRLMTLMNIFAVIYAVVLAVWYLPQLWHAELIVDVGPLASGAAFAGVLTAIFAVLIGSCCFAFLGSRTDFRLHS